MVPANEFAATKTRSVPSDTKALVGAGRLYVVVAVAFTAGLET